MHINVNGGRFAGQSGVDRHGIARTLLEGNPKIRGPLKATGRLTCHLRMLERKKRSLKRARIAS